jgi:hypothetical protein
MNDFPYFTRKGERREGAESPGIHAGDEEPSFAPLM